MQTRRANFSDLLEMQHCNLRCLPENYNLRYYLYHYLSWPELLHVTHDYDNSVCGYVLAKLDDEEDDKKVHGHVTSLAVLRTQRKLGIASKVMQKSINQMEDMTDAAFCSLHVRRTNEAALHLYQRTLGYRCAEIDEKYYVDGEDAFHMKRYLGGRPQQGSMVNEDGTLTKIAHTEPAEPFVSKKQKKAMAAGSSGCKDAHCKDASCGSAAAPKHGASNNANAKSAGKDNKNKAKEDAAALAAEIEAESKGNKKGGAGGNKKGKK